MSVINSIEWLHLIEREGLDINTHCSWGYSLLHNIVATDDLNLLSVFINIPNLDINNKDRFGHTPLHYALFTYNIDIINILLVKGADPNILSINGTTILQKAKLDGKEEVAQLLIRYGAK